MIATAHAIETAKANTTETPHGFALLNIPCTHILGTYATEAEAETAADIANGASLGAFVYTLTEDEAANLAAELTAETEPTEARA